ncbi:MAG: hypothetical protein IJ428_04120 [Clostridia bacterium]|nr:hypothetical protein [Clostridia bacterium]
MFTISCESLPDEQSGSDSLDTTKQTQLPKDSTDESLANTTICTEIIDEDTIPQDNTGKREFEFMDVVSFSGVSEVPEHKLSYVSYRTNGTVKNENDIRIGALYYGEHFYYTEADANELIMTVYNVSTHDVIGSFRYPFAVNQPTAAELGGYLFIAPCYYDNTGALRMLFIQYDVASDIFTIINDVPASSPRIDIEPIDENRILFFMYKNANGVMSDTIYLYDIESSALSIFYESFDDYWSNPLITSKNIRLVETFDERIWILYDQMINYEIHNYLEVHEADGTLVYSTELDALQAYGQKKYRAWEMYSIGDLLYFEIDITKSDEKLPGYVMLVKNGDLYEQMDISWLEPDEVVSESLIDDRYFLLSSNRTDIDLIVIDMQLNRICPVSFEADEGWAFNTYSIYSNEKGEILAALENVESKAQKLYRANLADILLSLP